VIHFDSWRKFQRAGYNGSIAMDLRELWALIEADLVRARSTLPNDAASHKAIRGYQEFLDHHELELACDTLSAYAEDHPVTREFWLALRDAATKMQLPERASQFQANAGSL
jgi:hypothetical protein